MTGFSQKYTIIHLLEPVAEGTVYQPTDWPLHTTLADIFAIDWSEEELIQNCVQEFKKLSAVTTTASDDTWFGDKNDAHVTLLEKNVAIDDLHQKLVTFLETGNVQFNMPQYVRAGFKPHVTVQKNKHLHKGDAVTIDSLTIIDMFPDDNPYLRKILKTIPIARPE